MLRFLRPVVLTSCIGTLAMTRPASGAVMLYSDRPTFLAHAGSVTTYGFEIAEGFPDGNTSNSIHSFAGGTITTSVVAGFASVRNFPTATTNQVLGEETLLVGPFAPTPLTLTFGPNRGAVGFDLYFPLTGEAGTVTVGFADNTSSAFNLTDTDANTSTPIFWGIVSSVPIRQLTTSGTLGTLTGMTTMLDGFAADVPAPATAPTAAMLLACGAMTCRRKRDVRTCA